LRCRSVCLDWLECSYLTAGAALVGAGAIALSPIHPAATAVHELQIPTVMVSSAAVELVAAPNPISTWVDVFANGYTNLSAVATRLAALPAPLARQVVANLINYVAIDISGYQAAAAGAVTYFTGTGAGSFQSKTQSAITNLQAGNIAAAIDNLYTAFIFNPAQDILEPMEKALLIPQYISASLAAVTKYLSSTFVVSLGAVVLISTLDSAQKEIGAALQGVYDAATAGDWLGTAAGLINLPGAVVDGLLNGGSTTGLLGAALGVLLVSTPKGLAQAIVSPGAQNIVTGGSLQVAWNKLITQLTTQWPSPAELATIPAGIVAGISGLPQAILGAIAKSVEGLLGGLIPAAAGVSH
jgi:hypothetical protein